MTYNVSAECQIYRASGEDNAGACRWTMRPSELPRAQSALLINARRWARAHLAHTGHRVIVRQVREEVFE